MMHTKQLSHTLKRIWRIPAIIIGKGDYIAVRYVQQRITGNRNPLGGQHNTRYRQISMTRQYGVQIAGGILIGQKDAKILVCLTVE